MKKSPFKVSNEGEVIDENFFVRLKKFENHYRKLSIENAQLIPYYDTIKKINEILQQEELSFEEIKEAIEIHNEIDYGGKGWLDLILHLRHIAFVYGKEYKIDHDLKLIEKEATT